MATTAKSKKLTAKEKRSIRDRTILEWILLVILLLLAYFFLAQSFKWWPYDTLSDNLGSAFYSTQKALDTVEDNKATPTSENNTGSSSGNNGTNGTNGNAGNSGSNGTNTPPTTPTTPTTPATENRPLLNIAGQINTGTTREQLNVIANGLNQNCTIVANTSTLGRQEVCIYTQGNDIITVTLLNNRVISASLSR